MAIVSLRRKVLSTLAYFRLLSITCQIFCFITTRTPFKSVLIYYLTKASKPKHNSPSYVHSNRSRKINQP